MKNMDDIAREIGVSRVTISRVLNNHNNVSQKTRDKILSYIEQSGFEPNMAARTLSRKKSDIIGIVCTHARNLHMSKILTTVQTEIGDRGRKIMILMTKNRQTEKAALLSLTRKEVDGLLVFSNYCDAAFLEEILSKKREMVFNGPGPAGAVSVRSDNIKGMEQIMTYLYGMGHRSIHYIGAPEEQHTGTNDERKVGYLNSMKKFDLEPSISYTEHVNASAGYISGKDFLLSADPRPTTIVCFNDEMAFGVMRAANEIGIDVPTQLSVTGFDGDELLRFAQTKLTTYHIDPIVNGKLLVTCLMNLIEGKQIDPKDAFYNGELVIGESTAPVAA